MATQLDKFFQVVDDSEDKFIARLEEAVLKPSISGDTDFRPRVNEMAKWLVDELHKRQLKPDAETDDDDKAKTYSLGKQADHEDVELPPAVVARFISSPAKRNIFIYGHYDVQPASTTDPDPFKLRKEPGGKCDRGIMYGRGATDDKGPIVAWLNTMEAYKEAGIELPVNLIMCFEGMEESGSEGLKAFIQKQTEVGGLFEKVDAISISDNYWLGTHKPCLTYGLRGIVCFEVTVSGPRENIHSGIYGGTVQEPLNDLVRILGTLVDTNGIIQIPGVNDMVAPVTPEEKEIYKDIDFDMEQYWKEIGSHTTISDDKIETLMHRWRYPSLTVHGVEGAYAGSGTQTIIPAKVTGKFSIRTVPDMDNAKLKQLVTDFVYKEFDKLGSKNTREVVPAEEGAYMVSKPENWNFKAAAKAMKRVFRVEPDLTREGGSIPVAVDIKEAMGKDVMLVPIGSSTDGAHSENEKLDVFNYMEGIKMMGAYLQYAAEEPMDPPKPKPRMGALRRQPRWKAVL